MTSRLLIIVALTLLGSSGCAATVQDYGFRLTNRLRAEKAWLECRGAAPECCSQRHFAAGFKHAYFRVSNGAGTCPPVVPTPRYWNPFFQSSYGQAEVDCWYQGYQCGVIAAEQDRRDLFSDVPTADGPTCPDLSSVDCPLPGCAHGCNCSPSSAY